MRKSIATAAFAVILGLPGLATADGLEFTIEEAIDVMRAAGTVMATESGLEHTTRHCAQQHPELAGASRRSLNAWTQRNQNALHRSHQLSDLVLRAVAERSGEALAVRMQGRMQEDTRHQARELVATLKTRPAEEQEYLCERMLQAMDQGRWDFSSSHPRVYQTLATDYASR